MNDPDWRMSACAGHPTELWFPDSLDPAPFARLICSTCTIREGCLEYSLRNKIRYGIWGGRGERERRQIRRLRKGPRMERVA